MTSWQKAEKLHKKVNTFFLSCIGKDGYPLTKAVVPAIHRESIREIYFGTNVSSKFAQAITENPKSGVYFYTKKMILIWTGCYLKGEMEVVTDMALKEKYWDWKYKSAYETKQYTDPDYCLLKFTPETGRLYANFKIEDFEVK